MTNPIESLTRKFRESGVKEEVLERVVAILSCDNIGDAKLANGRIGGGAGYDQVIALEFSGVLSQEEYIGKAMQEFSNSPLSPEQIREYMSDKRGSYSSLLTNRLNQLSHEEMLKLFGQMQLFKHDLLRRHFGVE